MKVTLNHPDAYDRMVRKENAGSSIYQTLLYTVLQKPRDRESGGVVIALSSSNPGEGVTYVSRALLRELAKYEIKSVAGVNVSFLRKLHEPTVDAIRKTIARPVARPTDEGHRSQSFGGALAVQEQRSSWEGSWQYRRDCIGLLREEFDYSIIDCPSLRESGDLLSVASFVDGVILVVEANRTSRDQPLQAERCISAAGGTVFGYILNKRIYEAPRWMYPDA